VRVFGAVAALLAPLVPLSLISGISNAQAITPPKRDSATVCPPTTPACVPPAPRREFRGVWVATARNVDWPSKPGLPTAQQQDELLAILDRAAQTGFNAVIFQVRPEGDAFYASELEPWSEYLTGRQGRAPLPFWDPLAFAVKEAHARGMELHAWFNPYRAKEPNMKGPLAPSSFTKRNPALVKTYGKHLWMDPGEPAVRAHTLAVILDVVKRYDIDAVHLDDYFYPYPERNRSGSTEFPDVASWRKYQRTGGALSRNDWRRENVNTLVEKLYREIGKTKPWVKFGVAPFGLWKPGSPPNSCCFDAFEKLFADSRTWLVNGWVDYFVPQLYWAMDRENLRYPDLLSWWAAQNGKQRHLWPGNYTSKIGEPSYGAWKRGEVLTQIAATRAEPAASGNVHFSIEVFMKDRDSIATALERTLYAEPALVPASPWLEVAPPPAPLLRVAPDSTGVETVTLRLPAGEPRETVRWWLVQQQIGGRWETTLLDGSLNQFDVQQLLRHPFVKAELLAVSAIDRVGNAGKPVVLRLP